MNDLETIRKKKLDELKQRYLVGGKKMEKETPNAPIKVTDADIDKSIKQFETFVIDCWAPWCGPCRMVAPIIDELAKDMQGKIVFGKLNVDENQQTSLKYNIMSIPTLLVFKNGSMVDRIIGALPKDMLKTKLQTY
ncbi:MAG: thioredoxin [Candidatus Thermoplasmatota archaeon]|nr:thioredoxin [Candidatus Thermoplasmatota archaeon]MBU1941681.1 thioredoxin [Candidatus Thermoplasmatota archaeon]